MSAKEFRSKFRVGDIISGWPTGKKVKITAIGRTRFLYYAIDYDCFRERVCAMEMFFGWKLEKRKKKP